MTAANVAAIAADAPLGGLFWSVRIAAIAVACDVASALAPPRLAFLVVVDQFLEELLDGGLGLGLLPVSRIPMSLWYAIPEFHDQAAFVDLELIETWSCLFDQALDLVHTGGDSLSPKTHRLRVGA